MVGGEGERESEREGERGRAKGVEGDGESRVDFSLSPYNGWKTRRRRIDSTQALGCCCFVLF